MLIAVAAQHRARRGRRQDAPATLAGARGGEVGVQQRTDRVRGDHHDGRPHGGQPQRDDVGVPRPGARQHAKRVAMERDGLGEHPDRGAGWRRGRVVRTRRPYPPGGRRQRIASRAGAGPLGLRLRSIDDDHAGDADGVLWRKVGVVVPLGHVGDELVGSDVQSL